MSTSASTSTTCIHHWLIEPGGEMAPGRCRKCGLEREFVNVGPRDYLETARANSVFARRQADEREWWWSERSHYSPASGIAR